MSGYFARLLSRAQQPAPAVRPQTALPFSATLPLDGSPELELTEESAAETLESPATRDRTDGVRRSGAPTIPHRDAGDDERSSLVATTPPPLMPPEREERRIPGAATTHADARAAELGHARGDGGSVHPARPRAPTTTAAPHSSSPTSSAAIGYGAPVHTDFRLMPDSPADETRHRGAANAGRDDAAFARAVEDARAQIHRQLASQVGAPSEVHVTIGRIEVTASSSPPTPPRKPPERAPAVSLEQYLASRARGRP